MSTQILNIFKYGYFTAPPGSLFLCLTIITVKMCFLVFRWNCIYFDLGLLYLGLSLGTVNKGLSPCSLSSIRYLYAFIMSLLKLILSQLASLNSFSLSSYEKCFSPVIEHWHFAETSCSIFCLSCAGQVRAGPSSPGVASPVLSEGEESHLFSTPDAPQAGLSLLTARVHCWLMFNLL